MAENIFLMESAKDNPLAILFFDLIKANIKEKPYILKELKNINLSCGITAKDEESEISLSLNFSEGNLYIYEDLLIKNHLQIIGGYEDILNLTRIPLFFGFPKVFSKEFLKLVQKIASKKIKLKIKKFFINPLYIIRVLRLITVL